jgi:hypothetical protein
VVELKDLKIFSFLIILSLLIAPVFAFGPAVHSWIAKEAVEKAGNNEITQVINENFDEFLAGNVLPDITVFYYFESSGGLNFLGIGKKYAATHNLEITNCLFSKAKNERQLAITYGWIGHIVEDHHSHNFFVPKMIQKTSLINPLIHGASELAVDAEVMKRNSELFERMKKGLNSILENDEDVNWIQSCMLSSQGVTFNVKENLLLLTQVLGSNRGFFTSVWGLSAIYIPLSMGNSLLGWIFIIISVVLIILAIFVKSIPRIGIIPTNVLALISFLLMAFFFILSFGGVSTKLMTVLTSVFLTLFLILSTLTKSGRLLLGAIFGVLGFIMVAGGISTFIPFDLASQEVEQAKNDFAFILQPQNFDKRFRFEATGFENLNEANIRVILYDSLFFGAVVLLILIYIFTAFKRRGE